MRAVLLVPLLLAVAAGIAALDEDAGIRTWLQLRVDLRETEATLEQLEAENAALRAEMVALDGEPFALERAIREDLDLARPGEVIVRFGTPPSGGAAEGLSRAETTPRIP